MPDSATMKAIGWSKPGSIVGSQRFEIPIPTPGADEVVDRRRQDPLSLPGPFQVVFDAAAAHGYFAVRSRLAKGGAYVVTLPGPGVFLAKALAPIHGHRCAFIAVKAVSKDLEQLAAWVGEGLKVPIDSTYPVRELSTALERLARGQVRGRLVIQVEGGF